MIRIEDIEVIGIRRASKWIETLPYMKEFLELDKQTETKE